MVLWTFPRSYGLHLWFGSTTKTTREFSPTFGHLAGNSGQKTTSRQLELDQPVPHGLMFVLGMQMMLLPPFITPCALLAAAHQGGVLAGFAEKYFENLQRQKTQP